MSKNMSGSYGKYTQDQRTYLDRDERYCPDRFKGYAQNHYAGYSQNQYGGFSQNQHGGNSQNQYGGYRQHPYKRNIHPRYRPMQYRSKAPPSKKVGINQEREENDKTPILPKRSFTNSQEQSKPQLQQKTNFIEVKSNQPHMLQKIKSEEPSTSSTSLDSSYKATEQKTMDREPKPSHLLTNSNESKENDFDAAYKPSGEERPDILKLYREVLAETFAIEATLCDPLLNITKVTANNIRENVNNILNLVLKENFANAKLTVKNNQLIKTNQQLEKIIIHLKQPIQTEEQPPNETSIKNLDNPLYLAPDLRVKQELTTPTPQDHLMSVFHKYCNAK